MDGGGAARVYVETSIPSFYFERRQEPEMAARRSWTRRWWSEAEERYDLVTSVAVLDELERGSFDSRDDCLELLSEHPWWPSTLR